MKLIVFIVLILLPNIFCDTENNVPAVIEDISEASETQKNEEASFKDDTQDLEKYVNRSKDLGQNGDAATMDSYIAAYRLYHEEYQNIEERKNDEIAKYNYDENIKHRKIRSVNEQTPVSASSLGATPIQQPAMVKFELSDAKTVKSTIQHQQHQQHQNKNTENRNLHQPHTATTAGIEVNKQQRGNRDKKSTTEELRMIQITHPGPTSYQTRSSRPLLDRLPMGLQKMIDIMIGGGGSKKGTVFTVDGKGLYKDSSNQRYATGVTGSEKKNSLPILFPPPHTLNNPPYNNFNDYRKQSSDLPSKQWWSNSENYKQKPPPTRFFQSAPQYHQYSYSEPKQVGGPQIPSHLSQQPYSYEQQESKNQQLQHYKFESLPIPQALHQSQQFQYQPQDTILHNHQHHEVKPEVYIKQTDIYQQISDNNKKPQAAFLHQQPQKSSEIYQQIQQQQQQQQQHQQQPTKPHSDVQEQQFIFGDYSFIPYSPMEIPIPDEKIESVVGSVSSTPAPIHEKSEKTAEQLDNERQIPSVAALAALIGKNPSTQLKGLSELLKQEQVVPQSIRPQDNTAPILFHPNGIPPRQQPPTTAIHIPKDQPAPKVISYDDFVKFYGKEKAHILLSENHQFEPAQDTKQEYIAPAPYIATTVQPEFLVNHKNSNHNLYKQKNEHEIINHHQRPHVYPTPLPKPKNNKINQHIPSGHKSVTILNSPKPNFDHPKPIIYKPKQPFEVQKTISNNQPEQKNQKSEKPHLEKVRSEYDGNSADDLQYAAEYEFGYRVRDYNSGNDFGHQQNRDNDGVTRGEYHILLPDGRIQSVKYTADDAGFHADVSYESVD